MIHRLEEVERRLRAYDALLKSLGDRLQAIDDRVMQVAGAMGGLFGPSSGVTFGRAVGSITARSGTTLGAGTFNFSDAPSSTLTEGAEDAPCKNLLNKTIADNSWLLLVREPDWWVVVLADDCANLS